MCDPVTIGFTALSMYQQSEQNKAEDAAIDQQNQMAAFNEEMQLQKLEREGQALHKEQIDIALAKGESAEDLAEAKFDERVTSNEEVHMITSRAFEKMGGDGNSVDSIVANARRGMLGNLNDMERNFQRGVKRMDKDIDKLEVEKKNRWHETKSNIYNLSRSGKKSTGARYGSLAVSGVSGYGQGKNITRKKRA